MVVYQYPTRYKTVTDKNGSFNGHRNRTPPSPNPGSDYPTPYGTPVYAIADGHISGIVNPSNPALMGGGGRMIYQDIADGNGIDYLHLSKIVVGLGDVDRGELLGYSGASGGSGRPGGGSDHYYDPHLHISIRRSHDHHAENYRNFDFDAMMKSGIAGGGGTPIIEEDNKMAVDFFIRRGATGSWFIRIDQKWKLLTQTPYNVTKKALGYGATEMLSTEADDLMALYPNVTNSGSIDIDALVQKIDDAISDEEILAIVQQGIEVDLQPVLDELAALDTQSDAYHAQAVAAVAKLPEALADELYSRLGS